MNGTLGAQETPYEEVKGIWAELPDGRNWGSTSTVYYGGDGTIWAAERCGANSNCLDTPDIDPVMQIAKDGTILKTFGKGMMVWPHGIHVDPDGNVWIADGRGDEERGIGHQVLKFSPDGELLMSLGTAGKAGNGNNMFDQPCDVLVAPNGDIFVADGHSPGGNNRVVKYNSDGEYIMEFGGAGAEFGEFYEPHSLAMDSGGRLFVADRYNDRVQIFDQEGKFLMTWRQFGRPSGVYIDHNDILYVADSESNSGGTRNPGFDRGIRIGSAITGWVTAFIRDPDKGTAFSRAEGVTADEDGNIYGAEVEEQNMRKYVARGTLPRRR
ncbi:MAG: hypothetical protein HOJ34_01055 [Kordiimonadaceae bacterium]|nr:hypothetical protein [Kordiimonadaceae bacterium]MBT6036422.1 hypothetical protein [Kordiimonadaceae bacterium]MBT6328345.1 hypothetical protein [Kordiimonadaceae bacterium]